MRHSLAPSLARFHLLLAALGLVLGASGAGARDHGRAEQRLETAFLTGDARLAGPLDLSAFAPGPGSARGEAFEGVLRIAPIPGSGGLRAVGETRVTRSEAAQIALPPAVSIALIADGEALIPAIRAALAPDGALWEWIFEPGRIWTDPADGGWSRASLPFALRERNANCTHNGVLTFLYRADGGVSRAAWEIASETCAYFKADIWGMAALRFDAQHLAGRDRLIAAYRREVAARLPTRPIEEIGDALSGVSAGSFGAAAEVKPANMTAYGVYAAGVHWVGGCATRHGHYPYCDVLDLPSYSLAKSLFAATALMRMELLNPGTSRERIIDHVPQCDGRWADVRLIDALDMATGLYASADFEADEDSAAMLRFLSADQHDQRAALACTMFDRREDPGRRWVYHTSDTYLVGTALQQLLRARNGPEADIYRDLIVDPIWRRLGLSPVLDASVRSYDAVRQPLAGWGLMLHRDDVVRLGRFYLGGGKIGGQPVIDPAMLAAALQRDPAAPGLAAGSSAMRYQHGFWAWDIGASIGCTRSVWVPFLSGYGGITVALFPNGVIYYYFSDGREFAWARAAKAANQIQSMCVS
ncbi:MAG: hypothetical protein WC804_14630 [Sphingomonas sp.]|jgi:hypothetical protein|uniref:hypothetical protein n=1 Tax=Sphingomonas sp. TaxID=28214 RepID=UPI00356A74DC